MNPPPNSGSARDDRLYALLPTFHRIRDIEVGSPLRALLGVIARQVNLIEDDIAQLYGNWFIETSQDWVVPYLGDLLGYRPPAGAGPAPDSDPCTAAGPMPPRREIANLIAYRRRKGSLGLLDALALDVGDWPVHVVECHRLLAWNQNVNHCHLDRHRSVDLRSNEMLRRLGGPFDASAHTVDVRRPDSARTRGRHGVQQVAVHAFRLKSHGVQGGVAAHAGDEPPGCLRVHPLGLDAPLFARPQPRNVEASRALREFELPLAISRQAMRDNLSAYYGPGRSLAIRVPGWADAEAPDGWVPLERIHVADLSEWSTRAPAGHVAVDPSLGRIAFPAGGYGSLPVAVDYHHGCVADIGGGPYARRESTLAGTRTLYTVGPGARFARIRDAVHQWEQDQPARALIEIRDSAEYLDTLDITLGANQMLQLAAAPDARPVLRLIDIDPDAQGPDALVLQEGSRITLDGLLITGRPLRVRSADPTRAQACPADLVIRHCTLMHDRTARAEDGSGPPHANPPCLEVVRLRARVRLEHSILGPIRVVEDEVTLDPVELRIHDSIVDAAGADRAAIAGPRGACAHASLEVLRCTLFGAIHAHAISMAENSIFTGQIRTERRQTGCIRYCHVPTGSRTPGRYHCQPDAVVAAVLALGLDDSARQSAIATETMRVTPQFTSERFGDPAFAQLAEGCADEILTGADDESELGVFHDLYQPQRKANLAARLAEYTPAGMDVGLFFAN